MPGSSSILSVRNLRVHRNHCRLLRGVSWDVHSGEQWAILGPNGSGKTSLLKVLTGYLMPTAGSIRVLDQVFGESDWRELRKHVGIVSSAVSQMIPDEESALDTVQSGPDAVIGFWDRATRPNPVAARQRLRQLGCAHLARRPWGVLSQGERQRILIARALMADPTILVLDEPCAGLDPVAREHFLEFIQRLGRSSSAPTLLLVTHHVEEIVPAFSHVLLLKAGRVLAAGPKKDTITPRRMTAAFGERLQIHTSSSCRYSLRVAPARGRLI